MLLFVRIAFAGLLVRVKLKISILGFPVAEKDIILSANLNPISGKDVNKRTKNPIKGRFFNTQALIK